MRKLYCIVAIVLATTLMSGCGLRRKKYETPIATDSKQPDKTLFDKAINDLEHSKYEVARLTLQTLLNTYPDSEYLAKTKLAIADSWYREGGTMALTQAENEYKDFITFFPMMPEAAEAQLKVAMIHYQQMEKADRDTTHALRAQEEFKQLLLQFPDSPFKEEAEQRLREVQEVLAEHEFRVGKGYFLKENPRASIPRLEGLVKDYPNYSQADQALWMIGEQYEKGGKNFRQQAANSYGRIIADYPISELADKAKAKLEEWEMPVPKPNAEAYARMKYDIEHRQDKGFWGKTLGALAKRPDVSMASKAGKPVLLPTGPQGGEEVAGAPNAEPGAVSITMQPVPNAGETPVNTTAPATAPATTAPATATPATATPATPDPAPIKPEETKSTADNAATPPAQSASALPNPPAADAAKTKADKKKQEQEKKKQEQEKKKKDKNKKNDQQNADASQKP